MTPSARPSSGPGTSTARPSSTSASPRPQQVLDHQESTARQYALADRAVALGWTPRPGHHHRRRPGQERPVDRGPARVPAAAGRGRPRPRRADPRPGDEPAGPLVQGLAPAAGAVRPLPRPAGRRRRGLRPDRPHRPAPARPARDDERGGASRPQGADVPGQAEQGPPRRAVRPARRSATSGSPRASGRSTRTSRSRRSSG